jgi:hypothetical protein
MILPRSPSAIKSFSMGACLCALALFIKALLPAGAMIGATNTGALQIEICTGSGIQHVTLDAHRNIITENKSNSDNQGKKNHFNPCVFSGLGSVALVQNILAVPILFFLSAHIKIFIFSARIGQGLAAPPPPAIGPPLI